MFSEPVIYLLIGLAIANAFLIGWVIRIVKSQAGASNGLAINLSGRFDGIDRNAEALRRSLTSPPKPQKEMVGKVGRPKAKRKRPVKSAPKAR